MQIDWHVDPENGVMCWPICTPSGEPSSRLFTFGGVVFGWWEDTTPFTQRYYHRTIKSDVTDRAPFMIHNGRQILWYVHSRVVYIPFAKPSGGYMPHTLEYSDRIYRISDENDMRALVLELGDVDVFIGRVFQNMVKKAEEFDTWPLPLNVDVPLCTDLAKEGIMELTKALRRLKCC